MSSDRVWRSVYMILERVWRSLNESGWVLQVCELYKRLQQLEAVNSIDSLKVTIKSWKRVWRSLNESGWVLQVCELYKRLQQLEAVNSIDSLKVMEKGAYF